MATKSTWPARARRAANGTDEEVPESQRETKRLSILNAAAKIFNERGYHQTSVDDVADALGVSKPTLYYYLKNKEQMLFECSRIATEQVHDMLDEVRKTEANGWDKLSLVFRGYAQVMTTDFGICLILHAAPGSLPDDSREKLWVGRRRLNREVERIIAQGIADRSIRNCDPLTLSFAIFGAFNWITYWYKSNGPLAPEQIADSFMKLFADGVKARDE